VRGGARTEDFAVLVRANADADPFLRSLNLRGILDVLRQPGLYGRPEVGLVAFLRDPGAAG
jgi:hypothetical protein